MFVSLRLLVRKIREEGGAPDFHMRKEEEEERLIPLAEESPTQADWDAIGEAFRTNDNPLLGLEPPEHADELFRRILHLAPPPLGVGEHGGGKRG